MGPESDGAEGRGFLLLSGAEWLVLLVLSSFMMFPLLSTYLVKNVGRPEGDLRYVYLCGGAATLLTVPLVGRLSDRFGKLPVFHATALLTLVPILVLTNLPPVSLAVALSATTLLMVASSGRMVPAMAMITGCAAPGQRGSFLSINTSVQQVAAGCAAALGGLILGTEESGALTNYPVVGALAAAGTLASVFFAGRLRPARPSCVRAATVRGREALPLPADARGSDKPLPPPDTV